MTQFFMELIFSRQKSFHLTNKRYENVRPIFGCTNALNELDKDVRTNVYDFYIWFTALVQYRSFEVFITHNKKIKHTFNNIFLNTAL